MARQHRNHASKIGTWPMDEVLIYDHCEWQLFVGSPVCPIRFCRLRVKPGIVIAMIRDDRFRPCEPWDWYENLAACGRFGILHIFGMVPGIKTHANDFDAEQGTNEFKSAWCRIISDFRQILPWWHCEDDESFQKQSAKGQSGMTGKNGSKGKAISKGDHPHKKNNQKVSNDCNFSSVSAGFSKGKAISKGYFKGSDGKGFKGTVGKSLEGIGKTRSTADDAR